jgi:hypothetical protein
VIECRFLLGMTLSSFGQSRHRDKYKDFSDDERAAHQRVHAALAQLGQIGVEELGGARDYVLKLTSGFHPASGVRGGKPKDLWFGIYRKENEERFLGNPQVFMIVSERGIEYGFSPLTHPDDFTNPDIKRRTREIARSVLEQLPAPGSLEAKNLEGQLSGNWRFRRKQRLDPHESEFQSLDDWLTFVRSDAGVSNAGGGISRYLLPDEIDAIDLVQEVRQMAHIFRPLMEHVVADAPPSEAEAEPPPSEAGAEPPPPPEVLPAFGTVLRAFLREFAEARKGPFQKTDRLWNAMSEVKSRLEKFAAVRSRPDLLVNIGVGLGRWAAVPWIGLLNTKVTRST